MAYIIPKITTITCVKNPVITDTDTIVFDFKWNKGNRIPDIISDFYVLSDNPQECIYSYSLIIMPSYKEKYILSDVLSFNNDCLKVNNLLKLKFALNELHINKLYNVYNNYEFPVFIKIKIKPNVDPSHIILYYNEKWLNIKNYQDYNHYSTHNIPINTFIESSNFKDINTMINSIAIKNNEDVNKTICFIKLTTKDLSLIYDLNMSFINQYIDQYNKNNNKDINDMYIPINRLISNNSSIEFFDRFMNKLDIDPILKIKRTIIIKYAGGYMNVA